MSDEAKTESEAKFLGVKFASKADRRWAVGTLVCGVFLILIQAISYWLIADD